MYLLFIDGQIQLLTFESWSHSILMDYLVILFLVLSPSSGQVPPDWFPGNAECDAICREGEDGEMSKNFGTAICYTKYCLAISVFQEHYVITQLRHDFTIF